VGGGKTLLSFLLPLVLQAKRPVLLLPASLIEKTWHDRRALAEHWRLPTNVQLISYEMLGRINAATKLDYICPDMVVADECHRIKNHRAGVTRRVVRFMKEHPETRFAGMSGTVMKQSIEDFAHILRWALKDSAPIPMTDDETTSWAEALDEKVNPIQRKRPGALMHLRPKGACGACWPEGAASMSFLCDCGGLEHARRVFQERVLQTPGVVASSKTDGVTCSLRIESLDYTPSATTEQHILHLRAQWETPDGWPFSEALELRRYARELALGFHGVWNPRPPQDWLDARKDWASFVREVISHSHSLDTELAVANAIDAGESKGSLAGGASILGAWRAIRPTFDINPEPVWHDDHALEVCAAWMKQHAGIVWTEHRFFSHELARRTGAQYFGADGVDQKGNSITLVKPGKAIIASVAANSTGRNLQMFSENLITSCPSGAATLEQLLGRTHRDGQEADEVSCDILMGCREQSDAFQNAMEGASAAADLLGHSQKLLLADVCVPDAGGRKGKLWR
jgi:hypothetical protein